MKPTEPAKSMTLTSHAFSEGQTIRRTYTGDGADVSPALQWHLAPPGTRSFAVICRDIDAPDGEFVHWVLYNIPGAAGKVSEGLPAQEKLADGSTHGINDFNGTGYNGPKPLPGRPHNYHFDLYALDTLLPAETGVSAARLMKLMKGHVLATAKLMGTYRR